MTARPDTSVPDGAAAPDSFKVGGLDDDVNIVIDTWGVPHIYAKSRMDAYLAQGFNAARDRLFQIDLWRRRGLGRLAEVLGPDHVAQDRATRLFLYRGDMHAEWLSYSTDARDVITAFVTGINSYIDWAIQDPAERLAPEFGVLGYTPSRWDPEDVVRIRTHGLLYNAEQELARALTLRDLGQRAEELRAVREPAGSRDGDVDLSVYEHLTDSVLDIYRLAFAPVNLDSRSTSQETSPAGSNNWVVAPRRSATGRPLLANDPHRAVTLPSLRYIAHLDAPGLSVIGAGEPNLPGISIGHNTDVAFALTIWAVDHEDLYVYELDADDPTRYRYGDGWESFRVVEETSEVAGAADVVHALTFTRHGPVVALDQDNHVAVAVRAVWLEPGMAPYLGSLEFQDARSAQDFRTALRRWGAPGVNMLYATTDGDIGWQATARVPRRPGWDGSRPVPGDGRYEWDGFANLEELPAAHNPAQGWFTTSNENNLPEDFDNDALTTTTDWYTSGRHERLDGWLGDDAAVDIDASLAMQADMRNVHGRRLLDMLASLQPRRHAQEWSALQEWDAEESTDSFPALLYQVWQRRHLRPWLVEHALQRLGISTEAIARARHRLLRADTLFSDIRPDMRMIEVFDLDDQGDTALLTQGVEETLGSALEEIGDLLGPDRVRWTWGELHRTTLRNPVLSEADVPHRWGELPSVPRPGSGDTVGLAGYDATFNAVMGSSFRVVMDVGEWDSSRAVNGPGQSGDPRSPHYADQLHLWADHSSFPLLFSRDAVQDAAARRITLRAAHGA